MVLVMNQTDFETAVANLENEITLGAININTLGIPAHECVVIMPAKTGMIGTITNQCDKGEARLYFGNATPALPY